MSADRPDRAADARALHDSLLVLDGHADLLLPSSLPGYFLPDGSTRTHLDKLIAGGVGAIVLSVAAGPGPEDDAGVRSARAEADAKLAMIEALVANHGEAVGLAVAPQDILELRRSGRIAVIVGFQNTRIIGDDLSQLEGFHARGARVFGLCHAGHTRFVDSARPLGGPDAEHGGLSALGRDAIRWINAKGALVDVAQMSRDAVLQTVALSRAPVVASHANVRALVDIARNLRDDELDAIKASGGLVMLTPFAGYLKAITQAQHAAIRRVREQHGLPGAYAYPADNIDRLTGDQLAALVADFEKVLVIEANLADYVDHIDYAVRRIGVDHVGIGTDFNHGAGIVGFESAQATPNVTQELVRRGYSRDQIAAIWGENFLRVWREAEALRD